MIKNFRGHFVDVSIPASSEPHFDGIDFSTKEKKFHLLFSIKLMIYLLLASFHPFLPRFLHDNAAVDNLVNSDVESSNN